MQILRIFTLLLITCFATMSLAQSVRTGKDYALFFVADKFDHWHGFPKKSTQQIRDIAQELEDHYGFRTEFIHNPDRATILEKLTTYEQKHFYKDDQLLIYFSMHGHYEEGGTRALIPKDGKLEDRTYDSWIIHPVLEDWVNRIPCEHILLSIDACYSGTFGGAKGKPEKSAYKANDDCASKTKKALQYKSRQYLTSGGVERTPIDSQFAEKWLEALRTKNTDGVLSYPDLFAVLSEASPKPRYGHFRDHNTGGDFVFVHKENCVPLVDEQHWQEVSQNPSREAIFEHVRLFEHCSHEDDVIALLGIKGESKDTAEDKVSPPGNMVFIKGGSFQMGSEDKDAEDDEKPVHKVTVDDFYMGRFEVTFAEFDAFCDAIGKEYPDDEGWGRGKRPMINVSWYDAVEYCNWLSEQHGLTPVYTISKNKMDPSNLNESFNVNWLVFVNWQADGYRLPTEAEWEYAARSTGRNDKWAGTSSRGKLATCGNYIGNKDGYEYTAPVGSFDSNASGLYDMSGNVSEWCWDWNNKDYYSKSKNAVDPKGSKSGLYRVLRDGSWGNSTASLRCTNRGYGSPSLRDDFIGFRLSRADR